MTIDQDAHTAFENLLEYLRTARGFDFRGYKRATLERRVERRMQMVSVAGISDYLDYLEVHPEEFSQLFNTILINVTDFFRDPPAWDYLKTDVLPHILSARGEAEPIRVWSAGCASGQEAYSLAIVFCELLGRDKFRERVKIYATDADEEALIQARHASYSAKEMQSVPKELRDVYFEKLGARFGFRSELRRAVIFGRHDLVQDAPISRVDLLACRNTLMYFNSEAQGRILARLHFALNEGGFLFLGRAETLFSHDRLFVPVNLKHRIFSKVGSPALRDRLLIMAQTSDAEPGSQHSRQIRIRDAAFDAAPNGQIVIDANGIVVLVNERVRLLFGLGPRDLGRPFKDLDVSYRPVELRSLIDQANVDRRAVVVADVERALPGGEVQFLDMQVTPLQDGKGAILGVSITFVDTTQAHQLQNELRRTNQNLETAYEELQSSNEELETTNEELQSANEELETTNEELQSANEELETMNEELQSSNEELQTVNSELHVRTDEFNRINTWLQSILRILPAGLIVVDRDLNVLLWNQRAEDLWGLRSDEVRERSLLSLDIGLPVEQLKAPIQHCLDHPAEAATAVLDAITRRGKRIKCKVTCTPFVRAAKDDTEVNEVALLLEVVADDRA